MPNTFQQAMLLMKFFCYLPLISFLFTARISALLPFFLLPQTNPPWLFTFDESPINPSWQLKRNPLTNADFSWFTDGSYLKNENGKKKKKKENGKYCARYSISAEVIEATHLSLATLAQQVELCVPTQACVLARGKTANIYTDWYSLCPWVIHDFETLWK